MRLCAHLPPGLIKWSCNRFTGPDTAFISLWAPADTSLSVIGELSAAMHHVSDYADAWVFLGPWAHAHYPGHTTEIAEGFLESTQEAHGAALAF